MSFAVLALPLLLLSAPPQVDGDAPSSPPSTESPAANIVFAEVLGSGLLYSLNYERILERWNVGLRAGASFFTYGVSSYGASGNLSLLSLPLVASYYVGWHDHKLQLGLGATLLYTQVSTDSQGTAFEGERAGLGLAATAVVGYRYIPRDGGISFGIGFTPLLRTSKLLPWGGANVGYAF
jgi:hypothetical protein